MGAKAANGMRRGLKQAIAAAAEPWLRVTTTDYYGRWETLGEPPARNSEWRYPKLKNGVGLRVQWPNGSVTKEKLVVQHGTDTEEIDMSGGPDRFNTQELFVAVDVRGVRVLVQLRVLKFRVETS